MKELRFKAVIPLNEGQKKESLLIDGVEMQTAEIYFAFEDLVGSAHFSIRELLIPWLLEGNQPELLEE